MRLKAKLNSRAGFSLAETLLAVLILLLVSVIMANGIPVARNVYNNVIVGANAHVALSTAVTALRNELGTATEVSTSGTDIIYYKSSIGAYSILSVEEGQGIVVLDYVNKDTGDPILREDETGRDPHPLITNEAANNNLLVVYGALQESDLANLPNSITIPNIQVMRPTGDVIASLDALTIRLIPASSQDSQGGEDNEG